MTLVSDLENCKKFAYRIFTCKFSVSSLQCHDLLTLQRRDRKFTFDNIRHACLNVISALSLVGCLPVTPQDLSVHHFLSQSVPLPCTVLAQWHFHFGHFNRSCYLLTYLLIAGLRLAVNPGRQARFVTLDQSHTYISHAIDGENERLLKYIQAWRVWCL